MSSSPAAFSASMTFGMSSAFAFWTILSSFASVRRRKRARAKCQPNSAVCPFDRTSSANLGSVLRRARYLPIVFSETSWRSAAVRSPMTSASTRTRAARSRSNPPRAMTLRPQRCFARNSSRLTTSAFFSPRFRRAPQRVYGRRTTFGRAFTGGRFRVVGDSYPARMNTARRGSPSSSSRVGFGLTAYTWKSCPSVGASVGVSRERTSMYRQSGETGTTAHGAAPCGRLFSSEGPAGPRVGQRPDRVSSTYVTGATVGAWWSGREWPVRRLYGPWRGRCSRCALAVSQILIA